MRDKQAENLSILAASQTRDKESPIRRSPRFWRASGPAAGKSRTTCPR